MNAYGHFIYEFICIWIHMNYEFIMIWFFHIWIHIFHEFIHELGCSKLQMVSIEPDWGKLRVGRRGWEKKPLILLESPAGSTSRVAIDSLRAADDSCTAEPGQPWDPSPTNLDASHALLFKKFRERSTSDRPQSPHRWRKGYAVTKWSFQAIFVIRVLSSLYCDCHGPTGTGVTWTPSRDSQSRWHWHGSGSAGSDPAHMICYWHWHRRLYIQVAGRARLLAGAPPARLRLLGVLATGAPPAQPPHWAVPGRRLRYPTMTQPHRVTRDLKHCKHCNPSQQGLTAWSSFRTSAAGPPSPNRCTLPIMTKLASFEPSGWPSTPTSWRSCGPGWLVTCTTCSNTVRRRYGVPGRSATDVAQTNRWCALSCSPHWWQFQHNHKCLCRQSSATDCFRPI